MKDEGENKCYNVFFSEGLSKKIQRQSMIFWGREQRSSYTPELAILSFEVQFPPADFDLITFRFDLFKLSIAHEISWYLD